MECTYSLVLRRPSKPGRRQKKIQIKLNQVNLQVREVAEEPHHHPRRGHGGRGKQHAAGARRGGGGEERAQVVEPGQGAGVEGQRREEPGRGRQRQRRRDGREDA